MNEMFGNRMSFYRHKGKLDTICSRKIHIGRLPQEKKIVTEAQKDEIDEEREEQEQPC